VSAGLVKGIHVSRSIGGAMRAVRMRYRISLVERERFAAKPLVRDFSEVTRVRRRVPGMPGVFTDSLGIEGARKGALIE
jgi:hypothetical protein